MLYRINVVVSRTFLSCGMPWPNIYSESPLSLCLIRPFFNEPKYHYSRIGGRGGDPCCAALGSYLTRQQLQESGTPAASGGRRAAGRRSRTGSTDWPGRSDNLAAAPSPATTPTAGDDTDAALAARLEQLAESVKQLQFAQEENGQLAALEEAAQQPEEPPLTRGATQGGGATTGRTPSFRHWTTGYRARRSTRLGRVPRPPLSNRSFRRRKW